MFIGSGRGGYSAGGEQWSKGRFLIVACGDKPEDDGTGRRRELRGIVRAVTLRQCGHFMMGRVEIGGCKLTLSGGFGNDGLPEDKEKVAAIWDKMVKVPQELADRYWSDTSGHNSVGELAPEFAKWALENIKALTKPIGKPKAEKKEG